MSASSFLTETDTSVSPSDQALFHLSVSWLIIVSPQNRDKQKKLPSCVHLEKMMTDIIKQLIYKKQM